MGAEVATSEEPEAAELRGTLRQIVGLVERSRETGSHAIDRDDAMRAILILARASLGRPRTNGPVIDELYERIATLEAQAIDGTLDRRALATLRDEHRLLGEGHDRLLANIARMRQEAGDLRRVTGRGGTLPEALVDSLRDMRARLGMIADYEVPPSESDMATWRAVISTAIEFFSSQE